jgi:hypothetical protein
MPVSSAFGENRRRREKEGAETLDLLRQTRMAVGAGARWPPQVQIAVSNAGGRKSGVSGSLARSGIRFIDYYQAPPRTLAARVRMAIGNQAIAGAVGLMLAQGLAKLGIWGIDREVRHRIETEYQRYIQISLARGLERDDIRFVHIRRLLSS